MTFTSMKQFREYYFPQWMQRRRECLCELAKLSEIDFWCATCIVAGKHVDECELCRYERKDNETTRYCASI